MENMLRRSPKQSNAEEGEPKNLQQAVAIPSLPVDVPTGLMIVPPRLPAIDIIRISLTWGILLYPFQLL